MRYDAALWGVDVHTGGQGMRVLTSGLGRIEGTTMAEKQDYFRQHHDWARKALCSEPRGARGMLLAVVTDPVTPDAQFGLLYMSAADQLQACGELTIAAVTALVELGLATPDANGYVAVDGPAGTAHTRPLVMQGRVEEVTLTMPRSFLFATGVPVDLSEGDHLEVDLCYGGGNVFAMVEREQPEDLVPARAETLRLRGEAIRATLNRSTLPMPTELEGRQVDMVEFYSARDHEGSARNVVIWDDPAFVNRAPCGTGTCARLAQLWHHGDFKPGDTLDQHGILGTAFRGTISDASTSSSGLREITPHVTGSARVTSVVQHLIHRDDPMNDGYFLAGEPEKELTHSL